jgi:hypothetical protein
MAITDYIPNIFGSTPEAYQGLLTPQQSQALERRANIGGLLGSLGALAQGMSAQGAPRSPLQNILTSIAAGYGAAGQTYESGINQLSSLQKLQQSQAQIEAINQLARDPAVASDPAMMAYLRANPAEAIKYLAETRQFQRAREAAMPTTPAAPAPAPATPTSTFRGITAGEQVGDIGFTLGKDGQLESMAGGLTSGLAPSRMGLTGTGGVGLTGRGDMLPTVSTPEPTRLAPVAVTGNPEIARLEKDIQLGLTDASVYSSLRRPQDAEATLRNVDRLRERQQQLIASEIDIDQRIANAPPSYKDQYATLKSIKETLKPKDFIDALQKIDTAVVESGKQFKFDGVAGNFAYRMFGTNDMTKMTPAQMDLVLRYQNAPTQADQTKIYIDAQRLKEETGAAVPIPASRESMIGGVPSAAPAVPPAVTTTVPSVPTAPRVAPRPVTTTEAKQVVREINKPVVDINVTPLIKQPDSQVPPKTKKELLVKQPSTVALSNYALKNVVDARDAAQKLLDNPAYIDSLAGLTAPLMVKVPDTDAFTANQLMQNLLGRAFVNELSQMRNASPTGGAVGNVAVAEMDSLSKIQSSLVVGMKKDELIKQLKQYINVSNRAIKTIPNEYARTYGYNGEFDDLLQGTVVERPETSALPQGVKVKRVR